MAVDALSHLQRFYLRNLFLCLDVTVACRAGDGRYNGAVHLRTGEDRCLVPVSNYIGVACRRQKPYVWLMYEADMVGQAVNPLPLDRPGIFSQSDGPQQSQWFTVSCTDHPVAGDTCFHRRDAGGVHSRDRAMAEGAVHADTRELVAIGVQLRAAVCIYKRLATGVRRVGKCDWLHRALVET